MFPIEKLKILPSAYLGEFRRQMPEGLLGRFNSVPVVEFTADSFGFYASVASVYSSKIEGEDIELDSYLKHRFYQVKYLPDYTRKADDLYAAYDFARNTRLDQKSLLKAHAMLSKHILAARGRGRIRSHVEMILDKDGRIEYVAAPPELVKKETAKLFHDLELLLRSDLDLAETFYFAAMLHLVFLKIHPMEDGNGRTSRLLEKWFLAEKMGEQAWFVPSERYYYQHLQDYYKNVHLGLEYETVDYDRCMPMLLMLVKAVGKEP